MKKSLGCFLILTALAGTTRADLVNYYSFDRQSAEDAVGDNDGTINGNPTFEEGSSGQANDLAILLNDEGLGFHDDFVSFDPTEFGDTFSVAAWIRPNGQQDHEMMAIAANTHGGFAGPDGFKWTVNQWDDPDLSLRLETGDTITGTNGGVTGVIFDDEWQHVAIAFDKLSLTYDMFHNGFLVGSGGILEFGDALPWQIGAFRAPDGGATNAGFIGLIDDVAVFDHVLIEDEATDIFENGVNLPAGIPGDFDGDQALTATDIDLLSAEVLTGTNDPLFDLNGDQVVDPSDRTVWVDELKRTYFGDANLDLEFNSSDFVSVFQAGEYEDELVANSGWSTGDWNGDMEFNSSDFVVAFQSGGFEIGPRAAVSAVPEPSTTGLWLALLGMAAIRRRNANR